MRNFAKLRLAKEVACHCHSGNASELYLGNTREASDFKIGDGAMKRDTSKNIEIAQPSDAREVLVLHADQPWQVLPQYILLKEQNSIRGNSNN